MTDPPRGTGRRAGGTGRGAAGSSGGGDASGADDAAGGDDAKGADRPDHTRRTASGHRRSLDPQGRRALFETPVSAARDTIRSGKPREGRDALFSTGARQPGTVVVTCSSCEARSRINLTDLGMRWLTGSAWLPGRRNSHWMRCPSCNKRTWCAIGWQE